MHFYRTDVTNSREKEQNATNSVLFCMFLFLFREYFAVARFFWKEKNVYETGNKTSTPNKNLSLKHLGSANFEFWIS